MHRKPLLTSICCCCACAACLCCSDRVQNLYFAYLFVLRAVMKAAPLLTSYDYNTGLPEEDAHTRQLITQLVGAAAAAVAVLPSYKCSACWWPSCSEWQSSATRCWRWCCKPAAACVQELHNPRGTGCVSFGQATAAISESCQPQHALCSEVDVPRTLCLPSVCFVHPFIVLRANPAISESCKP
jgi:hypothetical protein